MSAGGRSVLIVDDEPLGRELTRRALTAAGLRCRVARDGVEGYSLASSERFDAVVTDLRMPRQNGHTLCIELLQLAKPPSVVVVLTALISPPLVRNLMDRGVHDVVQKPVNYEVFAAKLCALIEQANSWRAPVSTNNQSNDPKRSALLDGIESSLLQLTADSADRLDSVFSEAQNPPLPPAGIRSFISRLDENDDPDPKGPSETRAGEENRRHPRASCRVTVTACQIDPDWRPQGEHFRMAMRDLSQSGARLLHTRAPQATHLALSWTTSVARSKPIQVAATMRWSRPCGPFYDIGVQFIQPG